MLETPISDLSIKMVIILVIGLAWAFNRSR